MGKNKLSLSSFFSDSHNSSQFLKAKEKLDMLKLLQMRIFVKENNCSTVTFYFNSHGKT